jgi:hypothetical protein
MHNVLSFENFIPHTQGGINICSYNVMQRIEIEKHFAIVIAINTFDKHAIYSTLYIY